MRSLHELQEMIADLFEKENLIAQPKNLYEPIAYAIGLGGKRIRPTLLLAACDMYGGDVESAKDAAIGIELFHNFTLLHDDLMDRSPLRRGKPTVYQKWDVNTAVLSGDTMYALAWRYFLKKPTGNMGEILQCFNETAIGVCEGQQYDIDFERQNDVSIEEYLSMIRLKTAVLLAGALKIGALYANADKKECETIYDFGLHLGLAFQIQDDLLDAYGDTAIFGKKTGQDIRDNKKTYLPLKAMEIGAPSQKQALTEAMQMSDEEQRVRAVMKVYDEIGLRDIVKQSIEEEYNIAIQQLEATTVSQQQKTPLRELMQTLIDRKK